MAAPANRPDPAAVARPRGRPRKTASQRDDGNRRLELVRAAARLFRRKGFDATSTRDIAAAVGMRSGSPFYHFKSKGALLAAVMEEGMRTAMASQTRLLEQVGGPHAPTDQALILRALIRNHFDVLLGPDSDFIPVMLYEWRSITPRQRTAVRRLKDSYEALWVPVLTALHRDGVLGCEPKLARLLIFGALNWSAQWFDPKQGASLDQLTDNAMGLFIHQNIDQGP